MIILISKLIISYISDFYIIPHNIFSCKKMDAHVFVNIQGIEKKTLLFALWYRSHPTLFYNFSSAERPDFVEPDDGVIAGYINIYCGRSIKCDLSNNFVNVQHYDHVNGKASLLGVVMRIRRGLPITRNCSYCDTDSSHNLLCSGCKRVYYCDRWCQRNHWRLHKMNCVVDMEIEPSIPEQPETEAVEYIE